MSRQIRVRAWDKVKKVMLYSKDSAAFVSDNWLTYAVCFGVTGVDVDSEPEDLIEMESTGLQDKNGVEIFEGDVVREIPELSGHEERKRRGLIEFNPSLASFVVALLDRNDGAWCQLNEGNPTNPTTLKYTEVIGNTHQHPHLLTEEGK